MGDFEELELEEGKPLTFSLDVETVPEFTMPELAGIKVKKPTLDVTAEHVDGEVLRQCTQQGELESVKDGFEEGDRLLGPGSATKVGDDEPFFTHDNIDVIVPGTEDDGRGHVLGLIVEGLAGMLKGKKVGDTLSIKTKGPDSHEMEEIRGKDLQIEIENREGQRIIPAPIDRLLEMFGLESEEIFRER